MSKLTITPGLVDSIDRIVSYDYGAEWTHYEETHPEEGRITDSNPPKDAEHIFYHLHKVGLAVMDWQEQLKQQDNDYECQEH
jgi:hypothetical protein